MYEVYFKGLYQGTYAAGSASHAEWLWAEDYDTRLSKVYDTFGAWPVAKKLS